jgi:hypothetical protein
VDELEAEVALLKTQVAALLSQAEPSDAPAPVVGGNRRRSRS